MAERARHHYAKVKEEIARPPDRFIAGEESALANWVESARSLPVFRLDKNTPLRIGKRPTLVHNAETLAHTALIARHGPASFRARGLAEEPGTCLVTVSGGVAHPGVVEVDRGTPLWDIAMRSQPAEPVQALLVGGYGGTWAELNRFVVPRMEALTGRPPAAAMLFREASIQGRLVNVRAADDLGRYVRLVSGRLPALCVPQHCEVLRLEGIGPIPSTPSRPWWCTTTASRVGTARR